MRYQAQLTFHLAVTIYGPKRATTLDDRMSQGFFVARNGVPVARIEQTEDEQATVRAYLFHHWPEHAKLLGSAS